MFLLFLFVCTGLFIVSTSQGAEKLIKIGISHVKKNFGIDISAAEISGSVLSTLQIGSIKGGMPFIPIGFEISSLSIEVFPTPILRNKPMGVGIRCESIMIREARKLDWLEPIPDVPIFTCLADMPVRIDLTSLHIERIEWQPVASGPIKVTVNGFDLGQSQPSQPQPMNFSSDVEFRNRLFTVATFTGHLDSNESRITGDIDFRALGNSISSQINVTKRKGKTIISGNIRHTGIELSSISHWLVSMWQDFFPFAFDGSITIGGTWAFETGMGFGSNLRGQLSGIRLVLLGFLAPILHVNGEWSLQNNCLAIEDTGSRFITFPAKISGEIKGFHSETPSWNLEASVLEISWERLLRSLPWALVYGSSIADIRGRASILVRIAGLRPSIMGLISSPKMQLIENDRTTEMNCRMEFRREQRGPDEWRIDFDWRNETGVPRIYETLGFFRLWEPCNSFAPASFKGHFRGHSINNLDFTGNIYFPDSALQVEGQWSDLQCSKLSFFKEYGKSDLRGIPETFSTNAAPSLWQFLLLQNPQPFQFR